MGRTGDLCEGVGSFGLRVLVFLHVCGSHSNRDRGRRPLVCVEQQQLLRLPAYVPSLSLKLSNKGRNAKRDSYKALPEPKATLCINDKCKPECQPVSAGSFGLLRDLRGALIKAKTLRPLRMDMRSTRESIESLPVAMEGVKNVAFCPSFPPQSHRLNQDSCVPLQRGHHRAHCEVHSSHSGSEYRVHPSEEACRL